MINLHKKLTEEQMRFCKYWLEFPTTLFSYLTSPYFGGDSLRALVVYEANTKKRKHVLNRLLGRYYRIERSKTTATVFEKMEELDDTGKYYREIPEAGSSKAQWPGD